MHTKNGLNYPVKIPDPQDVKYDIISSFKKHAKAELMKKKRTPVVDYY